MLGTFITLILASMLVWAHPPELPPSPCASGCNLKMKEVLGRFDQHAYPISIEPKVYSGDCRYLGEDYDPSFIQYAMIMIDQLPSGEPYFSTMFGFFHQQNPFQDLTLEQARAQSSLDWKSIGKIQVVQNSSRVAVVYPGFPPYYYWIRQNEESKELYYIAYLGGTTIKAFCHLKPHP